MANAVKLLEKAKAFSSKKDRLSAEDHVETRRPVRDGTADSERVDDKGDTVYRKDITVSFPSFAAFRKMVAEDDDEAKRLYIGYASSIITAQRNTARDGMVAKAPRKAPAALQPLANSPAALEAVNTAAEETGAATFFVGDGTGGTEAGILYYQ